MSGEANEPMARETFPKKRARSIMDRTETAYVDTIGGGDESPYWAVSRAAQHDWWRMLT